MREDEDLHGKDGNDGILEFLNPGSMVSVFGGDLPGRCNFSNDCDPQQERPFPSPSTAAGIA